MGGTSLFRSRSRSWSRSKKNFGPGLGPGPIPGGTVTGTILPISRLYAIVTGRKRKLYLNILKVDIHIKSVLTERNGEKMHDSHPG